MRTALAIGILVLFSGGRCSLAQPHAPLVYQGGPVLGSFTIYPLYYGNWSSAEIKAQQDYLIGLAAYISGVGAPPGEEPVIRQYGVHSAKVAGAQTASPSATPKALSRADVLTIINDNQPSKLPNFGPNTLIALFPAHGFTVLTGTPPTVCSGCGYHSSGYTTTDQFWAVVPADAGPTLALVTAHEIFEAATDPADDNATHHGWITADGKSEAVDGCNDPIATYPFITLSFGQIPSVADDTEGGACSGSAYIMIPLWHIGIWPGTIVRLSVVAGPVTPAPGTPVEAVLGFVDINGIPVGPSQTVPLVAGQVVSLDLNASLLVQAQGQHADVRPVVRSAPGAFLPPLRTTTEVFDSVSGFGAVLTGASPTVPGPAFGAQGLAAGQTMRIVAVAFPPSPCVATLSFAGANGLPIGPSKQVDLEPGHAAVLDLGSQAGPRVEVQPKVTLMSQSSACAATSEVFDNTTGRTWTYQTVVVK